jgi:flagellar hook-associated protein 1
MSLSATMNIGRSALTASQLGLQVTGNNMANAATPGYSRQIATMSPIRGVGAGASGSAGRGVQVTDIRRQIDEAVQTRLRSGLADEAASTQQFQTMSQLEAILGELGENDLSSELSRFFNSWSERANQTKSSSVVVQQGERLAQYMQRVRSDFVNQRGLLDRQLGAMVESADTILNKVGDLNTAIADAEVSGAEAGALRDERDTALNELGMLLDISAVEQPGGMVDVLIGSTPIMLNGRSRGLELRRESDGTTSRVAVSVRASGQELDVRSGQVGALIRDRGGAIDSTIDNLDQLASQLIFEINRIHSTGANLKGLSGATGELTITADDRARALNDPANATFAGLPFEARNGGFFINVKQTSTGQMQSVRVNVDLDGIDAAGLPGTADDTSAEDIRAALGAIPGLTATFTPDGRLDLRAAAGFEFSFSEDSSGTLAVLGMNTYFRGTGADNIAVRDELSRDPNALATGRVIDGTFRENGNALEIVRLQNRDVQGLGARTFQAAWSDTATAIGSQTAAAKTNAEAASLVRAGLEAQRAGVSGVSLDEESINLLAYQRQYQGAARLISVADEMFQTLASLI